MVDGGLGVVRRVVVVALVIVGAITTARCLYRGGRHVVLRPEETAAARGERLAADLGCFACHGPGGGGGTANAGSEEKSVPAFTEQTQMMYVKTNQDVREYILDGAPKRRWEDADYRTKVERAALRMPAYRDVLTDAQVDDLVAYVRASSGQIGPPDQLAQQGAELALAHTCFACHGQLGAGGVSNPRSFKGYVPGFWGEDFDELVRDDDELRHWIADGKIARIAEHPIGKIFFRRQKLQMPDYGRFLEPGEVDALVAYVKWIRAGAWRPQVH